MQSDILMHVLAYLTDNELRRLSQTPMWFLVREIVTKNQFWRLRCEVAIGLRLQEACERIRAHPLVDLVDWKSIYSTVVASTRDMSESDTLFCMDCGLLDPSEYNDNGLGSLRRGCKLGYCQVVRRCLVDWKLDPTEAEPSCLEVACWYGQVEIVKLLLADTRVDPSVEDSRPFMIAYLRGRSAVLEVLMADGRCDINMQEGQVPADKVELPHETEYLKIARLLLSDTRFNPASNNSWYLTYSSVLGHASVVQLLLGDGRADPRALNYRAVYQAWNRGHKETLDILLADPRVDIGTRMQYNGTLTVLCCVGNILLGTAIGMTILYAARHISMTIDRQAHLLHNLPLLLAVQLDSYDKLGE